MSIKQTEGTKDMQKPTFVEFLRERIGSNWYTAKRPSPKRKAGCDYISPKAFAALKAEYAAL